MHLCEGQEFVGELNSISTNTLLQTEQRQTGIIEKWVKAMQNDAFVDSPK